MQPTRREALATIAVVAAVSPSEAQTPAVTTPSVLTAAEMDWLKALVDTIIPRTETPGASDTGVPVYIDRRLAANPELAERFRAGMKALDADAHSRFGAAYPALNEQQRTDLLTPLGDDPFFRLVKGLTVDGYYTSQDGLTKELGWHGNTYLTQFPGCTHPEHQL